MSIIHDALKKVQHSLDRNYGRSSKPAAHHEPLAPNISNNPKPLNPAAAWQARTDPVTVKTMLWFASTVLVCLGIILILVLKILDTDKTADAQRSPLVDQRMQQRSQQMASFQSRQTTAAPRAATTTPKPAQAPQPVRATAKTAAAPTASSSQELILGGIMVMGDERVALINDDVYALGDSLDGKKITEITLKEVTLQDENGKLTTLKVLNRR